MVLGTKKQRGVTGYWRTNPDTGEQDWIEQGITSLPKIQTPVTKSDRVAAIGTEMADIRMGRSTLTGQLGLDRLSELSNELKQLGLGSSYGKQTLPKIPIVSTPLPAAPTKSESGAPVNALTCVIPKHRENRARQ